MDLPICEHIKPGGARCGSPAVRDQKYCYHHAGLRKAVPRNNLFVFLANPRSENDPDRKSTRLNSSHTNIYTLSLHDALPICSTRSEILLSPRRFTERCATQQSICVFGEPAF